MTTELNSFAIKLAESLKSRQLRLCLAESCTGGMLSGVLTEIPGSSAWFDRAFIVYSNAAKQEMLDVSARSLENFGAISEQVAHEMALGALANSHADISISITGIAGPAGGSKEKPVGTVYFSFCSQEDFSIQRQLFVGERQAIRIQSCQYALKHLATFIEKTGA